MHHKCERRFQLSNKNIHFEIIETIMFTSYANKVAVKWWKIELFWASNMHFAIPIMPKPDVGNQLKAWQPGTSEKLWKIGRWQGMS